MWELLRRLVADQEVVELTLADRAETVRGCAIEFVEGSPPMVVLAAHLREPDGSGRAMTTYVRGDRIDAISTFGARTRK